MKHVASRGLFVKEEEHSYIFSKYVTDVNT